MSADDESFHPLGSEWEAELEESLDETEYDTDLGLAMAEDAMRVTKGELSEAEFHEKYHEAVMEEFGVDDRPTEEAFEEGAVADALSAFDGDGEVDRREAMKKMGAGAAALGLGAWATVEDDPREPGAGDGPGEPAFAQDEAEEEDTADEERDVQWGMVIDLERCDGCLSCVTACSEEHDWDPGMNWMYVLDWEDPDAELNSGRGRLVRPCQHCTDAPCEKVCPTTARHTRTGDGLVLTDYEICIGCRYCQVACPYGVNYFQWDEPDVPEEELDPEHVYDGRDRPVGSRAPRGVMSKCTFCPTRQDGTGPKGEDAAGTTACEDACPPGAIQFGNLNDPESDPRQYADNPALARVQEMNPDDEALQEAVDVLTGETEPAENPDDDGLTEREAQALVQAEAGTESSTFKLLEEYGTDPNVIYIGDEPGPNAEQVPGPISYAEVGEVDRTKDVTDEGTVGFGLSG